MALNHRLLRAGARKCQTGRGGGRASVQRSGACAASGCHQVHGIRPFLKTDDGGMNRMMCWRKPNAELICHPPIQSPLFHPVVAKRTRACRSKETIWWGPPAKVRLIKTGGSQWIKDCRGPGKKFYKKKMGRGGGHYPGRRKLHCPRRASLERAPGPAGKPSRNREPARERFFL